MPESVVIPSTASAEAQGRPGLTRRRVRIDMPEWEIPGYTGLRALGSGGSGDVVLVSHDESGIPVAVKYLRDDLLADPGFAAMFRDEAAVLAFLDDPNVVRLYEYVESPSGAAIVMELIDGVSVREILSDQGKTSAEAALVVLQDSLLGLAAAHARGVLHQDYKPENVLVDGNGVSKLTDFGLAARAGGRPVPPGMLAYAPPEQFRGAPASPAGDVYAATATFYECLTGHPPFTGQTIEELLAQHRSEAVPLEPVPAPLRPLVMAGMAEDPARRPDDAAALVSELRTAAADAYGQDWEDRGRSHLAEAVPLLAALWPSGTAPAVQGAAVAQVNPPRRSQESRPIRPGTHLRRLSIALAVAVTAAAGAIIAVPVVTSGSSHSPSDAGLRSASATPSTLKLRPSAPVAASSPASLSPGSRRSATPGYNEYANPRYGFTALWPSSFRAQPQPEDRDGQAWTSPDGQVLLTAYGTNNVLSYSPEQDEAADARLLSATYVNISGDIVTVSGYKNNGRTIVYERDVVGPGSIDTLYWSYPANQKAQWNAAVTQTALTFQPGNVTTTH
jgi:eukaryotic-like serine/threonine-protein kinase